MMEVQRFSHSENLPPQCLHSTIHSWFCEPYDFYEFTQEGGSIMVLGIQVICSDVMLYCQMAN